MGHYDWAGVDNSNGYNGYWPNPGVKTDGIPMPSFRVARNGERPVYIGNIYRDYASGPGSIWQGIYYAPPGYGQVETQGGYLFPHSGGSFTFFIRGSAGTLQFGRCVGCGRTVQSENQAYAWSGTLAGAFDWAEVSTPPIISTYLNNNVFTFSDWSMADNGGSGVSQIRRSTQINGGSWSSSTSSWNSSVTATPGNTYRFRWYAVNGVGESEYHYSSTYSVAYSGGRRATGATTTTPLSISRRFNGSSWVDLSTRRRYTGSTWANITN